MKKVCFLNGHLILRDHKTGVHVFHEIVTKKIIDSKKQYDIEIAYFSNKETKKCISYNNNKWIVPFCKTFPSVFRIMSYFFPIEIFFGRSDVYFCDGLFPKTMTKAKRICLVHDLMVRIYPENYSFFKKLYLNLFFRKLNKADLVICVSENTKEDIMKYYSVPAERILVCYNGVDNLPENLPKETDNKTINLDRNYLFYIGDMRPNKNLKLTVSSFLQFCEDNEVYDLYFYIAGEKNGEYNDLCTLIEKSKYHKQQVVFLEYISEGDKYLLYHNCKAVIFTSLYEGFGMPIIEGMQHYKPIITSNCSSMKEIGEGTVILVDPKSIHEISEAINSVYKGKYNVNKDKYDEKIRKYSFDNVTAIINEGIKSVLN